MSTVASAGRRPWRRGALILLVIVVILLVVGVLTGPKVGALVETLTPPRLPPAIPLEAQIWPGNQNWTAQQAEWFHSESQGTHTLPVPLSWFLALEEPLGSPLALPFGRKGRFAGNDYLQRFGFIATNPNPNDPQGLPIGFATSSYQTLPGLGHKDTAVGLTCAACHTGSLLYQGKRYIVDGGPAAIDLGQFTNALAAALGQTALSEKLGPFGGRFERFAKAVLGREYSDATRNALAADLDGVLGQVAGQPNGVDVTEGFSRLDALNRIGNQVFALDPHRYDNYVNINAPVKFPHIWTSSWFSWVQYDGSIMQPLIRNAGEAMGVSAQFVFDAPPQAGRFASSIAFDGLHQIEQQLAGAAPLPKKAFTGLNAPVWPDAFPRIDAAKAAEGAKLYDKHCSGCHRPALTPDVAYGKAPDSAFWTYFKPIRWRQGGKDWTTKDAVLEVNIIPHGEIGTDPAQGNVLANRQVNTSGTALVRAGDFTPNMGLDIDICQPKKDAARKDWPLDTVHVSDSAILSFAAALGGTVQLGIDEWFRVTGQSPAERLEIEGDRPNCLQAGAGYKARPLNGVWAVAPFLHNGSVPTLYDLLSPVADRPKAFLLGDPSFDPVRVGLASRAIDAKGRTYDDKGYFILDTSRPGNRNTGHEFSDDKHDGVIGPALSPDDRNAIIEFLKSI